MTTLPRLTFVATLLAVAVCAVAAPPRVTGNRPVAIQVPISTARAVERDEPNSDGESLIAAIFPQDKEPATDGEEQKSPTIELKRARERLLKVHSLSAKVVERVEVLDKSFKAEGRYLQTGLQDGDWKMRFELAVKIGSASGSMLEVCNGEVLWTRSEIDVGRQKEKSEGAKRDPRDTLIMRCNVSKIMSALKKLPDKSYEAGVVASLGLGGLPALLASLEQSMKFTSVSETTLRDLPMIVVEGTWNDMFSQRLHAASGGGQPSSMLPPSAPDTVRVYIDRASGFPHRIMYLKKMLGRDVQKPMLTLDFLDVRLNEPINDAEFEYIPPKDVAPIERTQGIIEQIAPAGKSSPAGGGQAGGASRK